VAAFCKKKRKRKINTSKTSAPPCANGSSYSNLQNVILSRGETYSMNITVDVLLISVIAYKVGNSMQVIFPSQ